MNPLRIWRRLRAFARDADALVATILAFGFALGIWRASGCAADQLMDEASPDASSPPPADSNEPAPKLMPATSASAKLGGASLEATEATQASSFNVILVTVDTLRWDLGFAGYPRPVSPNLDAFAKRSIVYERAYATASYTMMCLAPLLIGRYASETARDYQHYTSFFASNVFLAERVQLAGGHTLAATTHHYFRSGRKGFEQGFDVWDTSAIPVTTSDNESAVTSAHLTDAAIALLGSPRASEIPVQRGHSRPSEKAAGSAAGRFFAWFHYLDPHSPYVAHEGAPNFASMTGNDRRIPPERASYDGEVWFTDKQIGRLLDHVARQPWASETAIVITADHGEAFGEHGHWKHGRELWEPLVHVPLLIFVPGVAARRIDVKRSHIDLAPTVLDLMGIPMPTDGSLRGKSLLADIGAVKTGRALEERDIYMDLPEGQFSATRRAIVTGSSPGLKLIDLASGIGAARYELYDLSTDPGETKNLAISDPARLATASAALQRLRASLHEIPALK